MQLNINDTVYCPCTNFNLGEHSFQELRVKELSEGHIVLTHVATILRDGDKVRREETHSPKDERGGQELIDYYSRPLKEIIEKYNEENDWICSQLLKDAEES